MDGRSLGVLLFFYFWNGTVINPMDQRVIVDCSIPQPRGRTLAHSWGKRQNPCVQVARACRSSEPVQETAHTEGAKKHSTE